MPKLRDHQPKRRGTKRPHPPSNEDAESICGSPLPKEKGTTKKRKVAASSGDAIPGVAVEEGI